MPTENIARLRRREVRQSEGSNAFRLALRAKSKPLIDFRGRFVVLFSAKSACTTVVIWFLNQMGLAEEARAHSNWPHHYRQARLQRSSAALETREALDPSQVKILRVVRDPIERAGSSYRHALSTGYADGSIFKAIGVKPALDGLSFERFIDFLETEDLDDCNTHHARQQHALEKIRPADFVINASREDLFAALNGFERAMGLPLTDFPSLRWIHELHAARAPKSIEWSEDPYRVALTREQARKGPWPKGLLTAEARARLEKLYAADIALYSQAPPLTDFQHTQP